MLSDYFKVFDRCREIKPIFQHPINGPLRVANTILAIKNVNHIDDKIFYKKMKTMK